MLIVQDHIFQVFVPQKMGLKIKRIFDILRNGVSSEKTNERSQELRHRLLKEGNVNEIRFVLGKIIATTLLHSKKPIQGADGEGGEDDSLVTDQPQKLGDFEPTRNTSAHLSRIFAVGENERKRTTPSNYEEMSDIATKRTRLSGGNSTTGHRFSEKWGSKSHDSYSQSSNPGKKILKDEHVKDETRSNR